MGHPETHAGWTRFPRHIRGSRTYAHSPRRAPIRIIIVASNVPFLSAFLCRHPRLGNGTKSGEPLAADMVRMSGRYEGRWVGECLRGVLAESRTSYQPNGRTHFRTLIADRGVPFLRALSEHHPRLWILASIWPINSRDYRPGSG